MTGKLVVGVDESRGAADALRWAAREGALRRLDVVAVLAWGFLDQHADALEGFNPNYTSDDADAALARIVAAALPAHQAEVISRQTTCDLPGRVLLDAAAGNDMLVLGARGLGGFRGLLVGSVSQYCLHHATTPTVIVRNEGSEAGGSVIVVGIDGSEHAERALAWATDEARLRGASLTVVHGYQSALLGAYPYGTMSIDADLVPEAARRLVASALEHVDTTGIDVTPVAMPGGAASAILDRATHADLVVVGWSGLGPVRRLLLGSVATQVVHHAPCPVAVIPAHSDDPA